MGAAFFVIIIISADSKVSLLSQNLISLRLHYVPEWVTSQKHKYFNSKSLLSLMSVESTLKFLSSHKF